VSSSKKYPAEIKRRSSDLFFLSDISLFREYTKKDFVGASLWSGLRSRFLSASVFTDEGKVFKVVFDNSLRKELAQLRKIKSPIRN
jgi:hypothetical protein